jgi:hypothetical protein
MAYLGTKPANQVIDSTLIADGTVTPSDLSTGAPFWNSSGNVGIGTSSPSGAAGKTLEINGGAGQVRIALKNNISGSSAGDGFQILLDELNNAFVEQREDAGLRLSTNAISRLLIDSAGRVTAPYQPAFSVTGNAGAVLSAGAVIPFNTIANSLNTGNHFNTSTSLFTAPVAGRYLFTFSVYTQAPSSICFRKNNAEIGTPSPLMFIMGTAAGDGSGSAQLILNLSANDTVGVFARTTQTSNIFVPHSIFCGYLLG